MTNRARSSFFFVAVLSAANAFLPAPRYPQRMPGLMSAPTAATSTRRRMSFVADNSDYLSDDTDFIEDPEIPDTSDASRRGERDLADIPPTEEIPVPMSRNNVGNRFLALVLDRELRAEHARRDEESDATHGAIAWEMHGDRVSLSEDHVMWARKQNLYNETFNTESMADVLWSRQLLSSDLQRTIGHAMCIDSPTLGHCREALSRDPLVRMVLGVDADGRCDAAAVPLYRWRHIRDPTLRRDDGRDGLPTMLLAFDRPAATGDGLREAVFQDQLEYWIRSERVIAAGPLHVATEEKTDPESIPVGTLMCFNAGDRDDAVAFVENDPAAKAGLYETMTVHRYNNLDVTGKFVTENRVFPHQITYQMKEAMEHWGYPVEDRETKWLNW